MNKEVVKPLLIVGGGIAAYESYQLYQFYKAFTLGFDSIKFDLKNKNLTISFNAVITNPAQTVMRINSVSGTVVCMDRIAQGINGLFLNYKSKGTGSFDIKPVSVTKIPIEVVLTVDDGFKLIEVAQMKDIKIEIGYVIDVTYKIFSLFGVSVSIPAKEIIDPKPYISQIKNAVNLVAEWIRDFRKIWNKGK
jgi:hypothetical protein